MHAESGSKQFKKGQGDRRLLQGSVAVLQYFCPSLNLGAKFSHSILHLSNKVDMLQLHFQKFCHPLCHPHFIEAD